MKVAHTLLVASVLSCGAVLANPMPVESVFTKRLPNSEERVRISEATFDDEFCIHVTGFASDGEHVVEITVYDASGRETTRIISPVEAKGAKWQQGLCPRAIKDIDAPGEWWFVVTLDDAPVVSASMPVRYGKPKASTVTPSTRPASGSQATRAKH